MATVEEIKAEIDRYYDEFAAAVEALADEVSAKVAAIPQAPVVPAAVPDAPVEPAPSEVPVVAAEAAPATGLNVGQQDHVPPTPAGTEPEVEEPEPSVSSSTPSPAPAEPPQTVSTAPDTTGL